MAKKYVKSIKFSQSGETYYIRDAEAKDRLDTLEPSVQDLEATVASKQDKLTAGANITIENNVISATGGGTGAVESVNGKTGVVNLSASDVHAATEAQGALADTAVQPAAIADMATKTELSVKQDKLTSANAGTNVTITEDAGVVKINATGSLSTVNWGGIEGTLSNQADLQEALNAKASSSDLAGKQDKLTSANAGTNVTITEESGVVKINATGSGGVSNYSDLNNTPSIENHPLNGGNNTAASLGLATSTQLESKQDKLVSGTNIKSINNESILDSGNLELLTSSDLDDYYTKTEVDNGFLSSNLQANQANIFDGNEPKNLFGETTSSETVVVPAAGIADLEEAPGTNASSLSQTVCLFTPIDQQAIQNKRIYQVRMDVKTGGKLDCRIINLNVSDRFLATSDFPTSRAAFNEASSVLFSATIPSSDTGIQNIRLDGTDGRVTYINPEFVEDGYIKIPTGYYLSFTDDTTSSNRVVWYYGGSQAAGNKYHFIYYSGNTVTLSGTTQSCLSISIDTAEEQTISVTEQNFDTYLATEETKKSFELAMKVIPDSGTANRSKGGIYVFNTTTQSALNDKILGGVEYYAVPGMTAEFVKATVPDNTAVASGTTISDFAGMQTNPQGSGVPSQYVLFRVNAADCTTDELTLFKLDGSDPRVEIVATDLYDAEQGGFPWDKTMMLALSDRRNPVTTGDGCMVYHTGVTGGSTGFGTISTTGGLTWGSATSTLSVNMYTTSITTQQTVHSDIIATALSDIEELKERNTDSPLKDKWISFLGDSITTWQGWSNIAPSSTSSDVWYPKSQYGMTDVNQSYWKKLIDRTGANLLVNNSWSGSRVSYGGHAGAVVDTGTGDRCKQLDKTVDGVARKPDYIVINIGTNDFDNNVLIGTWNGRGQRFPDEPDTLKPTTFREAYSVMLHRLRKNYPLAKIYCCTIPCGNVKSDGLNEINSEGISLSEYNDAIREVATAYGVRIVELATSGLDYYTLSNFYCDTNLHPNEAGMERYYELIRGALESNDSSNVSTPRLTKLMTGTPTAVADATSTDDVVAQFNALLAALRARGVISAS